nr:hypothetical protein [uncultured Campylobacter sp.]
MSEFWIGLELDFKFETSNLTARLCELILCRAVLLCLNSTFTIKFTASNLSETAG